LCRLWREQVLAYLANSCGRPSAHTVSGSHVSAVAVMRRV
ncbi:unnamed protein product, partial [Ectocarpus sp. 4 AP-2014]